MLRKHAYMPTARSAAKLTPPTNHAGRARFGSQVGRKERTPELLAEAKEQNRNQHDSDRAIQREQRRKRIHGRTTDALRGHAAIVVERVAVASTRLSMLSAVILAALA